jgi:hypothetical protein
VRARLVVFAALCLALAALGWLLLEHRSLGPSSSGSIRAVEGAAALARIRSGPYVVFRNTDHGTGYGRLALAAIDSPDVRFVTEVSCERVHAVTARALCLTADRGVFTTYAARAVDGDLAPGPAIPLTGPPSRARLAPDGRWAAFTVFESGHSYASASFSTRTTIVDAPTWEPLPDLEEWEVVRDGAPFREVDFNFWGVTFTPAGDRFYATLGTGGRIFLVEGAIAGRRLRILREDVECPSLSPDAKRLVFKSRRTEGGRLVWGLRVLDLESGSDTPLDGETRSVDDQAAWLDDGHVLYGLPEERVPATGGSDVWMMEARSGATPLRFLEQASSPAVVR